MVREGCGAAMIDSKGDRLLVDLEVGRAQGRPRIRVWTPEGPAVYNSPAHGTDTELADKVLAGEGLPRTALPQASAALPRSRRPRHDYVRPEIPVDGDAIDATVVQPWPETFEG